MSYYTRIITEQLKKLKRPDVSPAHVEAFMRVTYGTLDHLDRRTFNREIKKAIEEIDIVSPSVAHQVAESYGLAPRERIS
jgi:hypothetical protein